MDLTLAENAPREGFLLVEIERFQGPLDLLLHLIRTQDIDIFDIPIARITDQFLSAIKGLEADDLDGAGEFLEMAAALIHIKAQMLLPRPMEDEDEDPRAELVRRLLEYEQIREISDRLRNAEAERARRRGKGYVPPRPRTPVSELPLETTWEDVFAAALCVEMPVPQEREHKVTTRKVTMEEKAVLILDTLKSATRVEFSKLVDEFLERSHGVMTFLAGLELTRRRMLFLRQTRPFAELWIYRREDQEFPTDEASTDEAATDEAATDEAATDEAATDEALTDEAPTDEVPTDEPENSIDRDEDDQGAVA